MGYSIIIWIYEDGIRDAEDSKEIWEKIKPEVGEATLKVCFGTKYAEVRGFANCVNFCDEAHSTDAKLYLWNRNCLVPISKCNNEELKAARNIMDEEISFRKIKDQ